MIIAINARFLLSDYLEGYGNFIHETLKRIVINHPEHRFIFIFDRAFDPQFIFAENILPVVARPPARHPLLWKFWYQFQIPRILKKYKADVFLSADGFCSLNTQVPQCVVIHDLAFLHYPEFHKKAHLSFFKKYIPLFLHKASSIATVSQFSKSDIKKQFQIDDSKIDVVYSAAKSVFRPIDDIEKTETKTKYTEGKEFFLFTGAIHPRKNLMNLLKAFSLFKKRLHSNMKLVIAGRLAWQYASFTESLKSYKFRNDVVLTGYVEESELVKITGAAYAMVYPSLFEGFGVPPLESMQCFVPVITSEKSAMFEITRDAALYAIANDPADIAEKMMLLYKDETLRKEMIEKGKIVASSYSWDNTSNLLWHSILKAMQ
ncbi:MAG TPA: glycosyltransferase family 1 protein [Chitinophagaceae bacterium]|jgi:glycosyltransferase involved in cell wall biosynthesis|nr:glycosyltransferase family 1 protein [Chitinophagaceae bacterium]